MYVVVRCRSSLLPAYLLYFLKSDIGQTHIRHRCEGAVRFQLRYSDLEQIEAPLPRLAEQEQLVRILDEAEALRRLRAQAGERTNDIVASLFDEMFGNPVSNSRGLPAIPLGEVAVLERGKFTPRPRNDPIYFDGPYPFIQTGDIAESGGLLSRWKQTLSEDGKRVSKQFPVGTIVMAIVGATIGATAILQLPMYCTDSVVGIRANESIVRREYLEFVLRSRRALLRAEAPDAARANLNLEILRRIPIPVALIDLQREFVERVAEIRALQAAQAASYQRLEALFQSLLHHAFQGEL